jgi:dTDP-glucose 4,6-dehydratase
MRILVTGGAGFIGGALVRKLIAESEHSVLNIDKLTYAASPESLAEIASEPRYSFRRLDICDSAGLARAFGDFQPEAVMHLAAESHVDRSIDGPEAFAITNVIGTLRLLDAARGYFGSLPLAERKRFRFCHVSTDEVFGALDAEESAFSELSAYRPRSPYAASKAAADHFVRAYGHTYGLPVIVSNSTNNYGPYHFPEKLIPLTIVKALAGEALPVYGRGENVRDWLHVDDHAAGLVSIVERGRPGETYLLGGCAQRRNIDVVEAIADLVDELAGPLAPGRARRQLIALVEDRPGHDFRYAANPEKIGRDLGWRPRRSFEDGLRETVAWFIANEAWWRPLTRRYRGERLGAAGPAPAFV